ncbi:MAG: glycosyltransferase family 9 protein [Chlamydiae bacterium]|nr:glycosyltransferase family 9 protein [Chlamydiota bacterium]
MRFLIVKLSAIGDVIQSLDVIEYIHAKFKDAKIDWVCEPSSFDLLKSHPLLNEVFVYNIKELKGFFQKSKRAQFFSFLKKYQENSYDAVFDLQGNTKSAFFTFLAKSKHKVGFGYKSVAEIPNILATNNRFEVDKNKNIRLQYLELAKRYFKDIASFEIKRELFKISPQEKEQVFEILENCPNSKIKVLVCPFSKWPSKQLEPGTLIEFLRLINNKLGAYYFFPYGNDNEKNEAQKMQSHFDGFLLPKMTLAVLEHLMSKVDLIIAVDSSLLHLSQMVDTPSFAIFGPSNAKIYEPLKKNHFSIQGPCEFGYKFEKRCKNLRSCKSIGCIKKLDPKLIFQKFLVFWNQVK